MCQYLIQKAGRELSLVELCVLFFMADRYHLRKFGSTISCSQYIATKLGPIPTKLIEVYTDLIANASLQRQYN